MRLHDRKDRMLYGAVLTLVALGSLELIGQLRGFFYDIWLILRAVVGPLLIAIIATYVLRPMVDGLAKRKVPRTISILLIYVAITLLSVVLFMNILPLLVSQITTFIRQLPGYIRMLDAFLDNMSFATRVLPDGVRVGLEKALDNAEAGLVTWFSGTIVGMKDFIGSAITAFVIPFLMFYLLKDYNLFSRLVIRLFKKESQPVVERILAGIDESLGRYVRGQLFVMLLVGAATFVGLLLVGMPYALLLSLIVSLTNIIPYVGPFIGAAPALFMAFGVSKAMLIKVLLVNLVVQQLEGNVFSPWIMGKTMHLHPLLILLAIMFAGEVGGVVGLIFAVPILAVLKVIYENVRDVRM